MPPWVGMTNTDVTLKNEGYFYHASVDCPKDLYLDITATSIVNNY